MIKPLLTRIRGKKILVIGDVMLDLYTHGGVGRLSPEAPVPVVELRHREVRAGGAANVALSAAALGASVEVIGSCGHDDAARTLKKVLSAQGIHLDEVFMKRGIRTITKERVVAGGYHQICRIDSEDSPPSYRMEPKKFAALLKRKLKTCDAIILSDYAKGVIDDEVLQIVSRARDEAQKSRRKKIPLLFDPKPKRPLNFAGCVDVITPNRGEALTLAGMDPHTKDFPIGELCRRLHERCGPVQLVMTMSDQGYLISEDAKDCRKFSTYARDVVDVSGAGDTFIAGLACGLVAGGSLELSSQLANLASGVVVGKPGTATATPAEVIAHAAWVLKKRKG